MAQPPRLDRVVVAVYGAATGPHGVGFLVTEDHVVTCAHVVCQALGLPDDHPVPPDEPVALEFLLLDNGARVTARVAAWRPEGGEKPDDIAILRLDGQAPADAEPVHLSTAEDVWGHQVAAFGVPRDNEEGAWATGELRGRRAGGLIQVDDNRAAGFTIQQGFSGSPVWDEDAGGVVGMVISAGRRRRFACIVPSAVLVEVWPPARTGTLPPSPYRGLLSFREEDAELYFGRDDLADALAAEVRTRRVTVVAGPSGYGKSSLVSAGVLPRLRRRGELAIAGPVRPRGNPANEIAGALLELPRPETTAAQQLTDRPATAGMIADGRLDEVVDAVLDRTRAGELLLIVDQVEEALDHGAAAAAALAPVIRCALAPSSRLRALLVIRSDFLDRALAEPELAEVLQDVATVGAMTREQLRAAVTGPLRDGVTFETGLVQRIVEDVAGAPGQLPLLQSVLDQLWQHQERRKLTHRAYADLGGVSGALARYAEEKGWLELGPADRVVARRLFVRLVRVNPDLPATRRQVRRSQIGKEEWRLAQRLVRARLLVSGRRETVELAHEALISHWDRLRGWIERDREFLAWKEVVQEHAGLGTRRHLLTKPELPQARRWLRTRATDLTAAERTLIQRSLRARRIRWLRITALLLPVVLVAGLVLLATLDRVLDPDRGDPAWLLAMEIEPNDPTTEDVLLKTIAAYNTDPRDEAVLGTLFDRYVSTVQLAAVHTEPRPNALIRRVAASGDGRVMVTGSSAGAVLWRQSGRRMVSTDLKMPEPDDVAVSADGGLAAVVGDRDVRLFDDRGRRTGEIAIPRSDSGAPSARTIVAVATGALATWSSDEPVVRVWDLDGRRLGELPIGTVGGLRMWFAGDHRSLVTWAADTGEVRTWDVSTGASRRVVDTSRTATVNATGDTLVTCHATTFESVVRIHRLADLSQVTELRSPLDPCGFAAIDPSGRYLARAGSSLDVLVYDTAEQRAVARYELPHGIPELDTAPVLTAGPGGMRAAHPAGRSVFVYGVPFDKLDTDTKDPHVGAISGNGGHVASGTRAERGDPTLRLWDGRTRRLVAQVELADAPASVEFDASGEYLVVTFEKRHDVEVRAVPSLELSRTMSFPANENLAPPEVHLDGRGHLLASYANEIGVWDLVTGRQVVRPLPAGARDTWRGTTAFAVARDGSQVVAVSPDGHGLDVWDLTTQQSRHVGVRGVAVTGVVSTPWPGKVWVWRQSDEEKTTLELWDLTKSAPTGKRLTEGLTMHYPRDLLRAMIGSDGNRIVHAGFGGIDMWDRSGDQHLMEIDSFGMSPLAVHGRTVLFSGSETPTHIVHLQPDLWRDRLCDLLGRPDRIDLPDIPEGIRTTGLCPA